MDDIFDIAPSNILAFMEEQENRNFLIAQLEKRLRGCMISVDKILAKHETKQYRIIINYIKRKILVMKGELGMSKDRATD